MYTGIIGGYFMTKAFTLTEVLITIGLIGVVAALTLPTLINNTQGKERETQLKVGYAILEQGIKNMQAELGYLPTPAQYTRTGTFYPEYKKYFNKIFDCGFVPLNSDLCIERANNQGGAFTFNTDKIYKTLNNNNINSDAYDDGQFILPNGMLVVIENGSYSNVIILHIDINGKTNGPNRLGQDMFSFQLMPDGKLLPMGAPGTRFENQSIYCSPTSNSNLNGIGCTYKALNDKNYFKN